MWLTYSFTFPFEYPLVPAWTCPIFYLLQDKKEPSAHLGRQTPYFAPWGSIWNIIKSVQILHLTNEDAEGKRNKSPHQVHIYFSGKFGRRTKVSKIFSEWPFPFMLSLGLWLKDRERRKEGRKEGREGGKSWAEGKEIKKKNGNSVILDEFNLMFSLLALALYLG